jgi:hypothetical protein
MKKEDVKISVIIILFFIFLEATAAAGIGGDEKKMKEMIPKRMVCIKPTTKAPVIDGMVDEDVWSAAVRVGDFLLFDAKTPAREQTEVLLTYDVENFYILFKCWQAAPPQVRYKKYDSEVWEDDSVEIFIDPKLSFRDYYHFIINAEGVKYDEFKFDRSWNNDRWRAAAQKMPDGKGYIVEVSIPWEAVEIRPLEGLIFGLNLCRTTLVEGGKGKEMSDWSGVYSKFHSPTQFGIAVLNYDFAQSNIEIVSLVLESIEVGVAKFNLKVRNKSNADIPAEIAVELFDAGRNERRALLQQKLIFHADTQDDFPISFRLGALREDNIIVQVKDTRNEQVVAFANYLVDINLNEYVRSIGYGYLIKEDRDYDLWWCEGTYKVCKDRNLPEKKDAVVRLSAARNEYEPVQVVIRPRKDLFGVKVSVEDFISPQGSVIPAKDNVEVCAVEYVEVKTPTDQFGSKGLYPDPLVPWEEPRNLKSGENQPIWLTAYIPKEASSGKYSSKLIISADNAETIEIPIELEVFDFTLPDETHTEVAYGMHVDNTWHGIKSEEQAREIFDMYLKNAAKHRISVYYPMYYSPIKWTLESPRVVISNGRLKLTLDKSDGAVAKIDLLSEKGKEESEPVGKLCSVISQKENVQAVGYPSTDVIKEYRFLARTEKECILTVTVERTHSSPGNRKFEAKYLLKIYPGNNWFTCELVYIKNTDKVPWHLDGYFHLLSPAEASPEAYNFDVVGVWLARSVIFGLTTERTKEFTFNLYKDSSGKPHGDVFRHVGIDLSPGQVYNVKQPVGIIFVQPTNGSSGAAAVEDIAAKVRDSFVRKLKDTLRYSIKYDEQKDYKVNFDFSEFDTAAELYLDGMKFNAFAFGYIPGEIAGYPQFTPEFNKLYKMIWGAQVEHLRQKGWLSKAYCYWVDEPSPERYNYVKQGMQLLKEACPGLRRLLTLCSEPSPTEKFYGYVDIWVPVLSLYNEKCAKQRQRLGERVWWYVCCGPRAPYPNNFIDHPAINHRIQFWMMEKYSIQGTLYWSMTYWAYKNPWLDTASYASPDDKVGAFGNGDGYLLYPPVKEKPTMPVIKGPINSIRIEMIREGLEDREYFWLLRQMLEKLKAKRKKSKEMKGMIDKIEKALVELPNMLVENLISFEYDPQRLYYARRALAELITQSLPFVK